MPLQKLQFRPGVNRESTTLANEGGWFESDKVRWRSGYPEKIGGWTKDTGLTESTLQPPAGSYWGVCRAMFNWLNLSGYNLLALGTNLKYYIQNGPGGSFYDVTPIRDTTGAGGVTFAATNDSPTITCTDPGHGCQTGDFVTFSGAVSLGGAITAAVLNQEYQVTYISSSTYTITVPVQQYTVNTATDYLALSSAFSNGDTVRVYTTDTTPGGLSTGTTYYVVNVSGTTCQLSATLGGAAINITSSGVGTQTISLVANSSDSGNGGASTVAAYQITTGSEIFTTGVGWGSGGWGGVTPGYASTGWGSAAPAGLGIGIQLRTWSQSNFGQDLIFNPRGGGLYYWAVNGSPSTFDRGQELSPGVTVTTSVGTFTPDASCPTVCNVVTVSDASRFVIAFGCNDYGGSTLDPLLVRWSDQESAATWTPDVTNQAGSYRLSQGSEILTATQTRQEILIWTDAALYSMQYIGAPYVWGFQIMGSNLSIMGPNAVATANNVTYWMGTDKFYMYTGRVETLPCTLRQYVFDDINLDQSYQFFASTNEGYNEVWWFYCSANSTTIDRYVVFNHLEQTWYYGTMERTAWVDSPLRDFPMAAGYDGLLIYHEDGVDDGTTNPPSPIVAYCQSSDFDIGDGHNFGLVWRIIPDVTFDSSTVNNPTVVFTVRPRQNPGTAYGSTDNPDVVSAQNYQNQQTYNVQQFTEYAYVRIRGRQMAFKISSDGLGVAWQLGAPRLDVRPDGRR